MRYPNLSNFLILCSGIFWMIVYVNAVIIGFRDKSYAMPLWALGLNLSWEVMHSFLAWQVEGPALQMVINAIWAVLDLLVFYTFIRFGRKYVAGPGEARWFLPWSLLVLAVSFVIQYAFVLEFGIYPGRAYAAFLQNLLMSVLFIDMLVRRDSSKGQSLVIAVSKWLGTLAPTILFGILGTDVFHGMNRFILVTGALCSVFDLTYIAMLARVNSIEKRKEEINSLPEHFPDARQVPEQAPGGRMCEPAQAQACRPAR
jgi:hypothetical protein